MWRVVLEMLLIAHRDLTRFWRNKYWLAGQVAMNLADIVVFGLIFRGIVNPDLIPDYVRFITPGILSLSIFISSFSIGREVGVELRREVTHYLISLPVKRTSLVMGRMLGGVLRGLIYQFGFLVLASMILSLPGPFEWVIIVLTTMMLSIVISCLSISISTITRNFNLQATIRSLTYYILFFISNIFYPEVAIKARLGPLAPIVSYSPLSMATNLYRWGFKYNPNVDIVFNLAGLSLWALAILPIAYRVYLRNLIK
ncbi:MAG: ABC transporter permease [Desulfurococcaceae archaeon]